MGMKNEWIYSRKMNKGHVIQTRKGPLEKRQALISSLGKN